MPRLDAIRRQTSEKTDFHDLASALVVYHCHHFNLFLDQTVTDALGFEASWRLRCSAARTAARGLLETANRLADAQTPPERLEVASALFQRLGHGRLEILGDAQGGEAIGTYLHYGFTWREKYGARIRAQHPFDAFAAGYAATALELAFDLPPGSLCTEETDCVAQRSERCRFRLYRSETPATVVEPVPSERYEAVMQAPQTGRYEDRIVQIADGLRELTAAAQTDERGLLEAFGVYVTLHLADYYNHVSYETLRRIETEAPEFVDDLGFLFAESGHVCVFNTFGGILSSPEWEAAFGAPGTDREALVAGLVAIGRALGFGHWYVHEFEPDRRLVLRATSTYEAAYWLTHYPPARNPNEFFFVGAAQAIAILAHDLDWSRPIPWGQELYETLFKRGIAWRTEATASLSCGAPYSEVVVERNG